MCDTVRMALLSRIPFYANCDSCTIQTRRSRMTLSGSIGEIFGSVVKVPLCNKLFCKTS
jgi:hypothetical protein